MIHALVNCLERRASAEEVDYLRNVAQTILAATIATAAVVYIARGNSVSKLAPNS